MKKSFKIVLFILIAVIILYIIVGIVGLYVPFCVGNICSSAVESIMPKRPSCDVDWDGDCDEKDISCQNLYNEIEGDLNTLNYCQTDSDCDVLILGSDYIRFGCYHFINKDVDKQPIYAEMENYAYIQNCTTIINECAPAPKPTCIFGRCIYDNNQGG